MNVRIKKIKQRQTDQTIRRLQRHRVYNCSPAVLRMQIHYSLNAVRFFSSSVTCPLVNFINLVGDVCKKKRIFHLDN